MGRPHGGPNGQPIAGITPQQQAMQQAAMMALGKICKSRDALIVVYDYITCRDCVINTRHGGNDVASRSTNPINSTFRSLTG